MQSHFDLIQEAMAAALYGTASRAIMEKDLVHSGKTGCTNPHGEDPTAVFIRICRR